MLTYSDPNIPSVFCTPEPLSLEQYERLVPYKLELVQGYLIDGPDGSETRLRLLVALLRNCGLDEAVMLVEPHFWYDALDRMYGGREGG